MGTLNKAVSLAEQYHAGQVDKSGRPYIGHLARVAASVPTGDCEIVAWLHDIVEDTTMTLHHLRALGFSHAVVTAVGAITHQTGEPREDYIDRVTLNWLASTVKLADIADNINPVRIREWEEVSGKSKASYVRGRLADYNRIVEALKQVSTEHKEQV